MAVISDDICFDGAFYVEPVPVYEQSKVCSYGKSDDLHGFFLLQGCTGIMSSFISLKVQLLSATDRRFLSHLLGITSSSQKDGYDYTEDGDVVLYDNNDEPVRFDNR